MFYVNLQYNLSPYIKYLFGKFFFYRGWSKYRKQAKSDILRKNGLQDVENVSEIPQHIQKSFNKDTLHKSVVEVLAQEEKLVYTEQIELSRVMTRLEETTHKMYLSFVTQFGYLVIFGPYFPSTTLICFVFNTILLFLTVGAFSHHIRRQLSSVVKDIGIWNTVIYFLSYFATLYHIILVMIPGKGLMSYFGGDENSEVQYKRDFLIVIGGFSIVVLIKYLINYSVSRTSNWSKKIIDISTYYNEKSGNY